MLLRRLLCAAGALLQGNSQACTLHFLKLYHLQPAVMLITVAPCFQHLACPYPCVQWQMCGSRSAADMHAEEHRSTLKPISASSHVYLVLMKQT
jgi:hypothetical protein